MYRTLKFVILLTLLTFSISKHAEADFFSDSSLSMSVDGVKDADPPEWYLPPSALFDMDPYWRNYSIPIDKRSAVISHIADRLAFTSNVCPDLEKMISLNLKEASTQEVLDRIEEAIGSKIPRNVKVKSKITFTLKASDYRAFELIENLCIDSGLRLEFGQRKILISE